MHNRLILGCFLAAFVSVSPLQAAITLPDGYYPFTFASGIGNPTSIAFDDDGWLYVSRYDGAISVVKDMDGNGQADTAVVFANGFDTPLGVAIRNGQLYVGSRGQVTRLTDLDGDHVADQADTLITGLPAGSTGTTGLAFGPDDNLYVGIGAQGNLNTLDPWQAAILRFTSEGTFLGIFASGLRNPYDLAFHQDGELFATDNGPGPDSSWTCLEPPDELNWIQAGKDYGFPYCFGVGDCVDMTELCGSAPCGAGECERGGGCTPGMTAPIAEFTPHSSSDGMVFGQAFKGFTDRDLFVAQFGQQQFVPGCLYSSGKKVVRVRVRRTGQTWRADPPVDFATGLVTPLDVTVGPDSALYVAEFQAGRITRIFATGNVSGVVDGEPANLSHPRFEMSPNPAAGSTRVRWAGAPPGTPSRFDIYDVSGRLVRTLAGRHSGDGPVWNCDDASGRRVAPGIYFVRVESVSATARVLVIN